MNKKSTFMHRAIYIALAAISTLTFSNCVDEISTEARYTFTGNTVASYLEENEEYFSSFIEILKRGERFSLMKAYGTYTCFAPTNDAIARYLFEQDSIYQATKDTEKVIDNGIHSPELSELSDSMCKVIAQTHLIDEMYLTSDMIGSIIPRMNLNDRYLSAKWDTINNKTYIFINNTARIIERDVEVENGVLHALNAVLAPSTNTVPTQIGQYSYFSIFADALEETGIADSLQLYQDWKGKDKGKKYEWTDGLQTHFDEGVKCGRPASRYYGFTAFVESDSTFLEYGIHNLDDLKKKCKEWYPEATDEDPTSANNALYQFIAYHIVPRGVDYDALTFTGSVAKLDNDFEKHWVVRTDIHEYYETFNNRLIKVTTPRSIRDDNSRVINFSKTGAINSRMEDHINITIFDPSGDITRTYPDFDAKALNGFVHVIDKVLIYNEDEMRGNILNCIMRFDISALVPELVTNKVRWTQQGKAGTEGNTSTYCICNETDNYLEHSRHFKQNTTESRLFYLCPNYGWNNYQGDEFIATGKFDIEYKLPPVPEGTYEIRIGYSQSGLRGIVQFYVDDVITGIPIDLIKTGADPIVGWKSDEDSKAAGDITMVEGITTPYYGVLNDKEMKNRGYLKGPSSYKYESQTAREDVTSLRKVLVTKFLSADVDHWLRLKNVTPNDNGYRQIMHDYVEIVPIGYVRSEEISFIEKRK